MFKKLFVLTTILIHGCDDVSTLPIPLISKTEENALKELAIAPINEKMSKRYVYTGLSSSSNISFNTIERKYDFDKGRLISKVEDIISIPQDFNDEIINQQIEFLLNEDIITKTKKYIFIGKNNLKGYYKDSIKVISNNKVVEETDVVKGAQYRLTKKGQELIARKNSEILLYLGYLEAEVLSVNKLDNENHYLVTYTLSLTDTPTWLKQPQAINLFPEVILEIKKFSDPSKIYKVILTKHNDEFKII